VSRRDWIALAGAIIVGVCAMVTAAAIIVEAAVGAAGGGL
jgi:hypothetical protein